MLAQALGSLMNRLGVDPGLRTAAPSATRSSPDTATNSPQAARNSSGVASHSAEFSSPEFTRLEAEVLQLHRERVQITVENQLLNEIIGRSPQAAAHRLLKRMIPQTADGLAALIDVTTPAPTVLAVRGESLDPRSGISISNRTIEQLQHDSLLLRTCEILSTDNGRPEMLIVQDSVSSIAGVEVNVFPRVHLAGLFLVPLKEDGTLVGILATTALWPGGLRRSDQIEILGRLCQTVLRRFQHERHLEQNQSELWLAQEMLRLKSLTDRATDQPIETLGEFAARLCDATGMDRAALFLVSRRAGDVAAPVVEAGIPLTPTVATEWRNHEIQLANSSLSVAHGDVFGPPRLEQMGVDTLWGQAIAWPLQLAGNRLGTLVLSRRSRDPLPDKDGRLIAWSAGLLAGTLQRIYRDAAIRRQARHDGLTDLANRRTFDTLLAGEVDRVRQGLSEECSLLLADLDRFKSVNDQHGHQAGDEVLRVIARLLREHVGQMRIGERSLLARYGGEELAILLPAVGMAGALRVAEEIREAVEHLTIAFGDKRLGVTVSIGVASCPLHGLGPAELVAAADAALYRAKSEGRNRVCQQSDSPR